jgi:3,4-dihydroxy 2-butanone 4-phosphate synthase/GTP cyclohydrolase II
MRSKTRSTGSHTPRAYAGTSAKGRTYSFASTRSARPATSFIRRAAIAGAVRCRHAPDCRGGRGVLLYLNQEGRGIGLANRSAYELQDGGFDIVEANERLGFKADQRDYGMGVQILRELGVRSMRLMSNNPRKLVGIEGYGLSVSEWLPIEIPASESTRRYLKTKKDKLGHKLSSV